MKRFKNAEEIIKFVLLCCVTSAGNQSEATDCRDFLVIPGQDGPRWIVPSISYLGKSVLEQWHPYNFASKIKWIGLRLIYSMGVLGKFPGIDLVYVDSNITLQIPGMDALFIPVMYVGTPGSQQKVVVTLVSPNNGEPQAIMKVALCKEAKASLEREAVNLKKLEEANVRGVPSLLAAEEDYERIWEKAVSGPLTSKKLTQGHIDWLLRLPRSEKTTTLCEQRELLRQVFEKSSGLIGNKRQAVSAAIAGIKGGQIPLVLVHGDFAPWNLKRQADGNIAAIDWEEADWFGLPLWDLCHFFLIQAHLFKVNYPVWQLKNSPLIQQYLVNIGVDKKNIAALVLLYILLTVFNSKASCSEEYKKFLLSQIPSLAAI